MNLLKRTYDYFTNHCDNTFGYNFVKNITSDNNNPYVFITCDDKECKNIYTVIKVLRHYSIIGIDYESYRPSLTDLLKRNNLPYDDKAMEKFILDYKYTEQHTEIRMYEHVKKMKKFCPHFIDMYKNYNCSGKKLNISMRDGEIDNYYQDTVSVLELEFASLGTLKQNFKHLDANHVESIMFQVCYTLLCLQKYNNEQIRHNDLHFGNILLTHTTVKKIQYIINGKIYVVPTYGILVKLFDYDFAFGKSFQNIKVLARTYEKDYGIGKHNSLLYDVTYFLNNFKMYGVDMATPYDTLKYFKNGRLQLNQDLSEMPSLGQFIKLFFTFFEFNQKDTTLETFEFNYKNPVVQSSAKRRKLN